MCIARGGNKGFVNKVCVLITNHSKEMAGIVKLINTQSVHTIKFSRWFLQEATSGRPSEERLFFREMH